MPEVNITPSEDGPYIVSGPVTLTDVDGNTFIDFAGGVGCLNVGHSHPDVVAAAHEQLDRFSHTDFTVVPYELYVALAEALDAPLLTLDGKLSRASGLRTEVELIGES